MKIELEPIAWVRSPFKQKFGTPRQSGLIQEARGCIEFDAKKLPFGSLENLKDFSHLWLIFIFHQNSPFQARGKVKPPRLLGEKRGLLATRSPHRPNPLGLSLVVLESVNQEKRWIEVSGLDLVDGTPLLDIKPYIATYDCPPSSSSHWVQETPEKNLEVIWPKKPSTPFSLEEKSLIEKTLSFDPRNLEDKKKKEDKKIHKCLLGSYDIHFRVIENKIKILSWLTKA